jgi:hypothetical protein
MCIFKGRDYLSDLRIDGKIISNRFLCKYGVRVWNASFWHTVRAITVLPVAYYNGGIFLLADSSR